MKPQSRAAQGDAGEAFFRAWLETCRLPYMMVDQGQMSFPRKLGFLIKRPDFEVGVPSIGRLAVEVKHKTVYGACDAAYVHLAIDEIERLDNYEDAFGTAVWWFLKDAASDRCWLILNRTVASSLPEDGDSEAPIKLPLSWCSPVDPKKHGFLDALAFASGVSRPFTSSWASRRSSPPDRPQRRWFPRLRAGADSFPN